MDDFGNDIMFDYTPRKGNEVPKPFNWTSYIYFLVPGLYYKYGVDNKI